MPDSLSSFQRVYPEKGEDQGWYVGPDGRPIEPAMESYWEDDLEKEEQGITVPLTITMLVIGGFICSGALLFGIWEDWSFVDASYFCYITFTTIGFGDMVPGTNNLDSDNSKIQIVVTGLYQVLGMAVVSMCFQLMQDEIIAKFRWIAEKIKLDKGQDENDEDQDGTQCDQ